MQKSESRQRGPQPGLPGGATPPVGGWARAALDALTAHVCILDRTGTIVSVNRAWRECGRLRGGGPAQCLGINYLDVCDGVAEGPHREEAVAVARGLREVLGGARSSFEMEYPCDVSGGPEWFVLSAGRLERGAAHGIVVSHQPVTARKLSEYRLRELQKLQTLGTLAGGIAHDFNNSLAAMLGSASLGLDLSGDAEQAREHFNRILRAGRHARGLVNQILAFGRPRPGKLAALALGPLIEQAVTFLRQTLPEAVQAQVQIEMRLGDAPVCAWTDPTQLEQVLMNLATNAWHSMQGQPGHIVVGLETAAVEPELADAWQLPNPTCYAHLWVADDGSGMTETVQQQIFEPFFTTKPPGQGTGLGLAVVRNIVKEQHGALSVESAPGLGTTFHVYLPLAQQAPADEAAAAPKRCAPPLGGGRCVMVIDDDELVGTVTQALLDRAGYRTLRFSDASIAMQAVRERPIAIDLVVSDFNMPGLSGLDVAAELATLRADLPLVLISGTVTDDLKSRAARLGVRALVQKERAFEELDQVVHDVLQRTGRSRRRRAA